ncbi:MAG: 5-formyltetrahydrofolate cyclo-ligase [Actinobacteria bacterium]|nr:5-formyltetrahydrofolate cyclo-ligase [Actinomycetota bacterium]
MKDVLRTRKLAERNALEQVVRVEMSALVTNRLLDLKEFKLSGVVMAYASFGSEVETRVLIDASLRASKRVVLPVVERERRLLLGEIWDTSELVPGAFGIPEPAREALSLVEPEEVDLAIVPGVAFDCRGYRVGYGGGYYDRFLRLLRSDVPRVALAFDMQLVDAVPAGDLDLPVDMIITESRIIACQSGR